VLLRFVDSHLFVRVRTDGFEDDCLLVCLSDESEAVSTSETSFTSYQTASRNIPQDVFILPAART
jgi:hypothetical protein